jgi:hypothetical protein
MKRSLDTEAQIIRISNSGRPDTSCRAVPQAWREPCDFTLAAFNHPILSGGLSLLSAPALSLEGRTAPLLNGLLV